MVSPTVGARKAQGNPIVEKTVTIILFSLQSALSPPRSYPKRIHGENLCKEMTGHNVTSGQEA